MATNIHKIYTSLLRDLRTNYEAKALGPATKLIRWSVATSPNGVHISQSDLKEQFIGTLRMNVAKPATAPYLSGLKLHAATPQYVLIDTKNSPIEKHWEYYDKSCTARDQTLHS